MLNNKNAMAKNIHINKYLGFMLYVLLTVDSICLAAGHCLYKTPLEKQMLLEEL